MGGGSIRKRSRRGLLFAALGVILWAGLWPDEPTAENRIVWHDRGPGLVFTGGGQALSTAPIRSETGAMTLEVWLGESWVAGRGNQEIASLLAGDAESHLLLLGQFDIGLILHGIADNPAGDPKRDGYMRVDPMAPPRHLAIVLAGDGAVLFVDGTATGLSLPRTAAREGVSFGGRLLLGTSDSGWEPWNGTIIAVAVHDRALGHSELIAHAAAGGLGPFGTAGAGSPTDQIALALEAEPAPLAFYRLMAGEGRIAIAEPERGPRLELPERLARPLSGGLFSMAGPRAGDRHWFWIDVALNVAAFVPFGFAIAWGRGRRGIALAVVLGLSLSAGIELAQPWIPGRASSLVDLAMNGFGGLLGAGIGWAIEFDGPHDRSP